MDALLAALLLVVALGGWALLFRRTDDALHPLGVFLVVWVAVFGFAHLNVPRTFDEPYYAEPFTLTTYLAVTGALLSFAFGFWLADPGLERLDRRWVARRLDAAVSWERLRWVAAGLFVVASATTVHFVRVAGEIPLFSPRIDELRTTFKLPLLGYLWDLHYMTALFGAMLAVRSPTRRGTWGWGLLATASVGQLMFGGVRVSPMTAVAWVVVYLLYRTRRVRVAHLAVVVAVGLSLFTVIEVYRRTMFEVNPALVNPRVDMSPPATAWAHTAASFKNLQLTLQRTASPLNMGLTSYDLPKTLVPSTRVVDEQLSHLYGTHNTPTFLGILWFDFGVGGLVVMPGLYGALVALVYARFRRRPDLLWLVVYIDFLLAVVLAFRTHRFLGNGLIWFGGIALAVHLVVGRAVDDPALEARMAEAPARDPGPSTGGPPGEPPVTPLRGGPPPVPAR